MPFPVFENVTRPIRAGPFRLAALHSMYITRDLVDFDNSFPKDEASHLVSQLFNFLRIGRCAEAFCKREEGYFFFLLGFKALLDQFDQHAVVAQTTFLRDAFDLLGQSSGERYASANLLDGHGTILHRYGALLCKSQSPHFSRKERVRNGAPGTLLPHQRVKVPALSLQRTQGQGRGTLDSTHPVQELVPGAGEGEEPGVAIVQA